MVTILPIRTLVNRNTNNFIYLDNYSGSVPKPLLPILRALSSCWTVYLCPMNKTLKKKMTVQVGRYIYIFFLNAYRCYASFFLRRWFLEYCHVVEFFFTWAMFYNLPDITIVDAYEEI